MRPTDYARGRRAIRRAPDNVKETDHLKITTCRAIGLCLVWATSMAFGQAPPANPNPAPAPAAPAASAAQNEPAQPLTPTQKRIIDYLRKRFSVSDKAAITVGPFKPSLFPDFDLTTITVEENAQKESQEFFVSKDGRYLVQGNIYALQMNPQKEVEKEISLQDVPTIGPANAPVTIVEYADLECPMCAQAQDFLEHQLAPKYGDKVRVVFKEFPLVNIHEWAGIGAVANECVYLINPADFVAYRSIIYKNQNSIQIHTIRDQLLDYASQVGLDRTKLTACMNSKQSMPRVEEQFQEGQRLGVSSTPTLFINGKMIVGLPKPDEFFKLVDDALAAAGK